MTQSCTSFRPKTLFIESFDMLVSVLQQSSLDSLGTKRKFHGDEVKPANKQSPPDSDKKAAGGKLRWAEEDAEWREFQNSRNDDLKYVGWPGWRSTDETRQAFLDKVAPKRNRKNCIPGTYPPKIVALLQVSGMHTSKCHHVLCLNSCLFVQRLKNRLGQQRYREKVGDAPQDDMDRNKSPKLEDFASRRVTRSASPQESCSSSEANRCKVDDEKEDGVKEVRGKMRTRGGVRRMAPRVVEGEVTSSVATKRGCAAGGSEEEVSTRSSQKDDVLTVMNVNNLLCK